MKEVIRKAKEPWIQEQFQVMKDYMNERVEFLKELKEAEHEDGEGNFILQC